jgi:hypothetical protein
MAGKFDGFSAGRDDFLTLPRIQPINPLRIRTPVDDRDLVFCSENLN